MFFLILLCIFSRVQVAGGGKGKMVSYPYFMAFISLLNDMELLKQIYDLATKRSSVTELTKGFYLFLLLWFVTFSCYQFCPHVVSQLYCMQYHSLLAS